MPQEPDLSLVVPVYNERDSLRELHSQIKAGCAIAGKSYELLFIDDGSTDGTSALLDELALEDPNIGVVHFRRNFGKSPALACGFERARGKVVITLDADLQDDPAQIVEFVRRIEAGADLVSGWKRVRHDPLGKTMPSKLFNAVVRRASGIKLHDFNCGFKAYRIECIRELMVYGGFHRFLPVLAGSRGFVVVEVEVQHRARVHGVSKFGARRLIDGMLDLLTVLLVTRYRTRPLHFFGIPGFILGSLGLAILAYLTVLWGMGEAIGTRPLLSLGILMTLSAIQLGALGLLGELLVRTTVTHQELFSVTRESSPRGVSRPASLSQESAVHSSDAELSAAPVEATHGAGLQAPSEPSHAHAGQST